MPIFDSGYGSKSNPNRQDKILIADSEAAGAIKGVKIDDVIKMIKGSLGDTLYFTASGTWTKPANLKFIVVKVLGAGGGGGGAATSIGRGAGGGAGGMAIKKILADDLAASESVVVGAAGNGGAVGNFAGQAGGNSYFKDAFGGGGLGGNSNLGSWQGYNGGTPSGGDLNIPGGGGVGRRGGNSTQGGAAGGFAPMGLGFPDWAVINYGNPGNNDGGQPGLGYGSGGGGGLYASTNIGGGAGAPGLVIIEEYF